MKKYCPACYNEPETESMNCPDCGTALEDPLTDEESEEMLELLNSLRA